MNRRLKLTPAVAQYPSSLVAHSSVPAHSASYRYVFRKVVLYYLCYITELPCVVHCCFVVIKVTCNVYI